jgi:hypothetical protein
MNRTDQGMLVFFAVIAVAGVAFWFLLPDGPETVSEQDVTVELGAPEVGRAQLGNATYWNATLVVNGLVPHGYPLPWSEVAVVLRSANNDVLFTSSRVRDLDISGGALGTDGSMPAAWYINEGGGDPTVSKGDALVLTGLTLDHRGAELELLWKDHRVGVEVLPLDFE